MNKFKRLYYIGISMIVGFIISIGLFVILMVSVSSKIINDRNIPIIIKSNTVKQKVYIPIKKEVIPIRIQNKIIKKEVIIEKTPIINDTTSN